MNDETRHAYRRSTYVWIALLILLLLTYGSAYVKLGVWNSVINMAIAVAKALLVAIFFMHLRKGGALLRVVAVTAIFTLSLLFILSHADYATRVINWAPWQVPAE